MSGAATLKEIFTAGFGNDSTIFVIFMMIFLAVIENMGLTDYLANWFITRKFLIGRPYLFTFFILLGAYLISAFVSTFAAIFVFWGIIYSICKKVGYKPYDKYPTLMVFGVIFMAQIGKAVQYAIPEDVQRMGYGAAHGGEQRHHDDRTNGQNQAPHGTTSTATLCGRCRT